MVSLIALLQLVVQLLTAAQSADVPSSVRNQAVTSANEVKSSVVNYLKDSRPSYSAAAQWEYKNDSFGIEFKYPSNFPLYQNRGLVPVSMRDYVEDYLPGTSEEIFAILALPEDSFPNTDFSAGFMVFTLEAKSDSATCGKYSLNEIVSPLTYVENISGNQFQTDLINLAALGTKKETKIYHTFKDGKCFEMSFNVLTTGDDFPWDKHDIAWGELKQILETVKIK